ncbi:hypothetical protein Barb4_01448 [Bacteroidales bacterium Barb4]|nr:hypothetical protein Barb4_01448 [Bacteroidales bacterium Barb4]
MVRLGREGGGFGIGICDRAQSKPLFRKKVLKNATPNTAAFISIIMAMQELAKIGKKRTTIYTENAIALKWVKERRYNTDIKDLSGNEKILSLLDDSVKYLLSGKPLNPVKKWKDKWGKFFSSFQKRFETNAPANFPDQYIAIGFRPVYEAVKITKPVFAGHCEIRADFMYDGELYEWNHKTIQTYATKPVGAYLSIVEAMRYLEAEGENDIPIVSNNLAAVNWVNERKSSSRMPRTWGNLQVLDQLQEADKYLQNRKTPFNPVLLWDKERAGKFPIVFDDGIANMKAEGLETDAEIMNLYNFGTSEWKVATAATVSGKVWGLKLDSICKIILDEDVYDLRFQKRLDDEFDKRRFVKIEVPNKEGSFYKFHTETTLPFTEFADSVSHYKMSIAKVEK